MGGAVKSPSALIDPHVDDVQVWPAAPEASDQETGEFEDPVTVANSCNVLTVPLDGGTNP